MQRENPFRRWKESGHNSQRGLLNSLKNSFIRDSLYLNIKRSSVEPLGWVLEKGFSVEGFRVESSLHTERFSFRTTHTGFWVEPLTDGSRYSSLCWVFGRTPWRDSIGTIWRTLHVSSDPLYLDPVLLLLSRWVCPLPPSSIDPHCDLFQRCQPE